MEPPQNSSESDTSSLNSSLPMEYAYQGAPSDNLPRVPKISFDVISQAWLLIKPCIGTYVSATAIMFFVIALGWIVAIALTPGFFKGNTDDNGIFFLVGIAIEPVVLLLAAGIMRMSINHLRTGRPNFNEIFSAVNVFPSLLVAAFLLWLAIFFGLFLCVVPGLLLMGLYLFVIPLIVDRRLGPLSAMRTSFEVLKPQMWMALVFAQVVWFVGGTGYWACLIGVVVTIPLAIMSIAITYCNFFDGKVSPPSIAPPLTPSTGS